MYLTLRFIKNSKTMGNLKICRMSNRDSPSKSTILHELRSLGCNERIK